MSLKIGYDLFAASSQAGVNYGSAKPTTGKIQLETAKNLGYKLKVQRLSDNNYWNNSTPGWQAGAVAEADELDFSGSENDRMIQPTIRRCEMRLPVEVLDGIDGDGCVLTAYAKGDTPATEGVAITLAYQLQG